MRALFFIFGITLPSCVTMNGYKYVDSLTIQDEIEMQDVLTYGVIDFNQATYYKFKDSILVMPLIPLYESIIIYDPTLFESYINDKKFPGDVSGLIIESEIENFDVELYVNRELMLFSDDIGKLNFSEVNIQNFVDLIESIKKRKNRKDFYLLASILYGKILIDNSSFKESAKYGFKKILGGLNPFYTPVVIDKSNGMHYELWRDSELLIEEDFTLQESMKLSQDFPKRRTLFITEYNRSVWW